MFFASLVVKIHEISAAFLHLLRTPSNSYIFKNLPQTSTMSYINLIFRLNLLHSTFFICIKQFFEMTALILVRDIFIVWSVGL